MGFIYEMITAIVTVFLVLFFGIGVFYMLVCEFFNLDGTRDTYVKAKIHEKDNEEYQLQKMNETLTRNRNDSLTKTDHYGDK